MQNWIAVAGRANLQVAWDREPWEALVRAIAHQQLHGKAAETILSRFQAGFRGTHFPTPGQVCRASSEKLRAMGFSSSKVLAIQGIAAAARSRSIPSRHEAEMLTDDQLVEQLVQLRGVGRWTVEMMLIFTLGRMDVMPMDDFGIKSGLSILWGLASPPTKKEFPKLTDHWRPWRSLAAWYLWRLADSAKQKSST